MHLHEQFKPLEEFIYKQWDNISDLPFITDHTKQQMFDGYGKIEISTKTKNIILTDYFYLFRISGLLYSSTTRQDKNTRSNTFDGIGSIMNIILEKSELLKDNSTSVNTEFVKFYKSIPIDGKHYKKQDKQSLFISHSGKTDLLYSISIDLSKKETPVVARAHESLYKVLKINEMNHKISRNLDLLKISD